MKDVLIIGGGVIGCLIARELAKYRLDIALVERHADVACETSKANSAVVHAGFDAPIGTNKAKYNVRGNLLMAELCAELNVHFKRNGAMVVAFNDIQVQALHKLLKQGIRNGVPKLSVISGDEARAREAALSKDVQGALLAETSGIICPFELAHNAARHAAQNGVNFIFNTEVTAISKGFTVHTTHADIKTRVIINAAGVFADNIAKMLGDNSINITPRKGEYLLYDKIMGNVVSHTIFQTPTNMGKGILVTPTVHGNLLIGPTAHNIDDKNDTSATLYGTAQLLAGAHKSVPILSEKDVITAFCGLRAVDDTNDFVIGNSPIMVELVHAAGLQSPGLSAAPAIAEEVAKMVCDLTKNPAIKDNYQPRLSPAHKITQMSWGELQDLIQRKPEFGNVICRCETVSEGEIKEAIYSICGATTIDGVKRRTRAGMGRCQGAFCMPKVLEILSDTLNKPCTAINKSDDGSYVLISHTKGGGL